MYLGEDLEPHKRKKKVKEASKNTLDIIRHNYQTQSRNIERRRPTNAPKKSIVIEKSIN